MEPLCTLNVPSPKVAMASHVILVTGIQASAWTGLFGGGSDIGKLSVRGGVYRDSYGRCEQVPDMRSCLSSGAMEQGSS